MSCCRACPPLDRLKTVKLLTKPNGFNILAGRGDSRRRLSKRIQGNAFAKDALPEPYARVFRV